MDKQLKELREICSICGAKLIREQIEENIVIYCPESTKHYYLRLRDKTVILKVYMMGNDVYYTLSEGSKPILEDMKIEVWDIFLMSMDAIKLKHPKIKLDESCFNEEGFRKEELIHLSKWGRKNKVEMI